MKLGIDLGRTKIEAAVIDDDGVVIWRERKLTPQNDYRQIIQAFDHLITAAKENTGYQGNVGMAIPGSIDPQHGVVAGSSLSCINGKDLAADCQTLINRPFRLANDANCFALSEARDGAAAGCNTVFGAIIGTGCGGGLVVHGRVLSGGNGIAGEWGHTPLPWPLSDEYLEHDCWCGQTGCLETFISGTALAQDYENRTGTALPAQEIAAITHLDLVAESVLQVYEDRLGRALAQIINIIDPDAIVLGGGLSNLDRLYTNVPRKWQNWIFSRKANTPLLKPTFGDSSGVRGAAWLWDSENQHFEHHQSGKRQSGKRQSAYGSD